MIVCGGVAALADDRSVAQEGQGGVHHVRIMLAEPVMVTQRPTRLTAVGPRSLGGPLTERTSPIADVNATESRLTHPGLAQSENVAHLTFGEAGIAGFDLRATLPHAGAAPSGAAGFSRTTPQAAAQTSPLDSLAAATPDGDRAPSLPLGSDELANALGTSGKSAQMQGSGYASAAATSPRIEYLPFSTENEAGWGSVTTSNEVKAAGVSSAPSTQPPVLSPFIAARRDLSAADVSLIGAEGRGVPLMPAIEIASDPAKPRPEDLETLSAQSPATVFRPSSHINASATSGGGGTRPSTAHLFANAGAGATANRQMSAGNQLANEGRHPNHFQHANQFQKPVTSVPDDFWARFAGMHGSLVGFDTSLDEVALRAMPHDPDDQKQVQLKALVELFRDRFEANEWDRISRSHALEAFVPVSKIKAAGIPVGRIGISDQLAVNLAAVQSSPASVGRGSPLGSGSGGFFGTKQSLAVTASAGYDRNPFLAPGGQGANVASVRIQAAPSISREGERNAFRLSGRLEHIEYLGTYSSLQNYGADFTATRKASERLQLVGGLVFSSDNLATNLSNPYFNSDLAPEVPVPPVGNDITVLGQQRRRTSYGANAGFTYLLSYRDELRWAINARADRFGSNGLTDSDFVSQQLRYSRQVGEGLAIGAAVDASLVNYSDPALGDAKTVSPQFLTTVSLSPRLEVTGSLGVAITRAKFGVLEETTRALAGNLSLCRQGERSNFCLNGSRQTLPSALGGARVQTTGGLSYSYRLSERDSLRVNGSYSTASEPLATAGDNLESWNGSVRFERQLTERLQFFASGGYLKTSGNIQGNASNYQALVGVTFNLGNSR